MYKAQVFNIGQHTFMNRGGLPSSFESLVFLIIILSQLCRCVNFNSAPISISFERKTWITAVIAEAYEKIEATHKTPRNDRFTS